MRGLALNSSLVSLLDPSGEHYVAIRTTVADESYKPRVSVVSGGGSGHEPMAAGYVGEGMLTAAVAGEVFASPSASAVSAMLHAIAPKSTGILVIVMNYQGDKLNFGEAIQELKQSHPELPVRMILVEDDVALPHQTDKRGIAGTIFVLKIAGAAADQGRSLDEVTMIAEKAAASMVSYGVALDPCTIPGHEVDENRLQKDESK
ncbi:dihydroxyacetone kinase [Gracilaria domingensis]|nr:dihydroxyacetone kinase [Gracilaria domingensis]